MIEKLENKEKKIYPSFRSIDTELTLAYLSTIQEILDNMKDTSVNIIQDFQHNLTDIQGQSKQIDEALTSFAEELKDMTSYIKKISKQQQEKQEQINEENNKILSEINKLADFLSKTNTNFVNTNQQLQQLIQSTQIIQDLFLKQQKIMKLQKNDLLEIHNKIKQDMQKTFYAFIFANGFIFIAFYIVFYFLTKK